MHLFIIGNGFDLLHGLPTRYWDFKKYLERVDQSTFREVEKYVAADDLWSNLEASLAYFDAEGLMDDLIGYVVSYGADDWSDHDNHAYEYEVDRVVTSLTMSLSNHFRDWTRTISPKVQGNSFRLKAIDRSARYLSFNYTPTLEELYDVDPSQIFHIHGRSSDEKVILGHGWDRKERFASSVDEDTDVRIAGGYRALDSYFTSTFKPTVKIIAENRAFFDSLAVVTEISVLGHSVSEVDAPYFEEIIDHIDKESVRWVVSYHETLPVPCPILAFGIPLHLVRRYRLDNL